jgi:hypothetical protein
MGGYDWQTVTATGAWRGASAGGFFEETLTGKFNPQFSVQIPSKTRAVFSLLQADARFATGRDGKRANFAIGMHVLKVRDASRPLLSPTEAEPVDETGEWTDQTEVSVHVDPLESGTYVVVPSTFDQGKEGTFTLRVFTSGGVVAQLRALRSVHDVLASRTVDGAWRGAEGAEGGSLRHESWVTNPQFTLSLVAKPGGGAQRPVHVTVGLTQGDTATDPDDYVPVSFYALRGNADGRSVINAKRVAPPPAFSEAQEVFGSVPLVPGGA